MVLSSDSEFEFDLEEKEVDSSKNKFLDACINNDYNYVKEHYKENFKYINQALSRACKNNNNRITALLINNGAYRCRNCESVHRFKAVVVTPKSLYVRKERFSVIAKNQDKSFGEIASILNENWKKADRYEKSLIKGEAQRLNKKNLKCLD